MGIPGLNQYFRNNCTSGINQVSLNNLRGKKIVVDTSIYLYRYLSEEAYIENIYLLLTKLRQFNISAIFVFDGKPPEAKYDEIQRRYDKKLLAENEYNTLKKKYDSMRYCQEKNKLKFELDNLRRQFIKLTADHIDIAKKLIRSNGMQYYEAEGEADLVCAKLVQKKKVYACLSEDMDMFVYGCKRVLRYISLNNSTVIMYDLDEILKNLNFTFENFKDICLISGSDYNKTTGRTVIKTIKYYLKYKAKNGIPTADTIPFYEWLQKNTNYIVDAINMQELYNLFDLTQCNYHELEKIQIKLGRIDNELNRTILIQGGFIFVD